MTSCCVARSREAIGTRIDIKAEIRQRRFGSSAKALGNIDYAEAVGARG